MITRAEIDEGNRVLSQSSAHYPIRMLDNVNVVIQACRCLAVWPKLIHLTTMKDRSLIWTEYFLASKSDKIIWILLYNEANESNGRVSLQIFAFVLASPTPLQQVLTRAENQRSSLMATFFLSCIRCSAPSPIHSNINHSVSLFVNAIFIMENQSQFKNDSFSIKKILQNILAKEHLMLITALKDHTKTGSYCHCGGVFLRSA